MVRRVAELHSITLLHHFMNNIIHKNEYEPVRASLRAKPQLTVPLGPPKRNRLLLRRIDPWRGLQIYGVWYWHPRFAKAGQSEPVDVRVLPWNLSAVSVRFRGSWIVAKLERSDSKDLRFDEVSAFSRRVTVPDIEEYELYPELGAVGALEAPSETNPTR
jgi:hypothetical protein